MNRLIRWGLEPQIIQSFVFIGIAFDLSLGLGRKAEWWKLMTENDLSCSTGVQSRVLKLIWQFKNSQPGRVRWFTPVIPALWEAKAGRSRGQEFETNLINMMKPRLYKKLQNISWAWWHVPVVPATHEAGVGGWGCLSPGVHCSLDDRARARFKNKPWRGS